MTSAFIDTHCHIDLYPDPKSVVAETEAKRIYTIAVTNTPSVFSYTESISKGLKYVRPAIGLHPELVVSRKHELPQMWKFLEHTRYVGEIGLDYQTTDESNRTLQRQVFEEILRHCSAYGNKIITIHSRHATGDVISAIGNKFPGIIILHWYSGSIRDLLQAIDYGFYFSVNSAMVNSQKGTSLIQKIPRERLLTETDGPFIHISGKPSLPTHIPLIVNELAKYWEIGLEEAKNQIFQNFLGILET